VSRRQFAATWWGQAWVDALEQRARLDPNRLPRGRTYARQQRVGELTVAPGEVVALVQGRRAAPYRVRVRVRAFTDAEWDTVLDAIAARAAHAAALLDGELPPAVLDDVGTAGIDLLPGPGEIGPRCSCPDWADPCKHSAAVCYLVADVLDRDPFELFHLRGRDRDAVLAALRARRARSSGARASAEPHRERRSGSVEARVAYARAPSTAGDLWSLAALPPVANPGRPAPLPIEAPLTSGIRIEDLTELATDAARRAWELTTGTGDGGVGLDADHDLARHAASLLGTRDFDALATRAGVNRRQLVRRALAWRAGGVEGVDILSSSWVPETEALDDARDALRATGARPRVSQNRVTAGSIQLRLGRSGRWYRCDKRGVDWELAIPPHPDPRELLTDAEGA
jgi:uncharacterized Zn finger protein